MPRFFWMPNLRPGRCCGGDGRTTGSGQSGHVKVKGRGQRNVSGPDEVHLVTTAGPNLWWVPLEGVDNQATAPATPNSSERFSRVEPRMPRGGQHPPCGPSQYIICGHVQVHESARVVVLDNGYQTCIYLGCEGDFQRVQLIATDGHGVISCADIRCCSSDWGEPKVGSRHMRR